MRRKHRTERTDRHGGVSLAKGPAATVGLILVTAAILGMTVNGDTPSGFPNADPVGSEFLGVETNGWTNILLTASGALLLFGTVKHWAAKTMCLVVGAVLGAAAVISLVGGDIVGLGATNIWTTAGLAGAGAILLITALLPKAGRRRDRHVEHDRNVDQSLQVDRDRDDRFVRDGEPGHAEHHPTLRDRIGH